MTVLRGQVLLFRSSGKWYENLICQATSGPFCHCELVLDATHIIGAHTREGIVISTPPINPNTFTAIDITPYTTPQGIEKGLEWAARQYGKQYGYLDIAYQAIKFLAPNNPFQITQKDHWDCSDFATRYLQEAGVPLPEDFDDPYTMTPNDIGRVFGLVAPRKGK